MLLVGTDATLQDEAAPPGKESRGAVRSRVVVLEDEKGAAPAATEKKKRARSKADQSFRPKNELALF